MKIAIIGATGFVGSHILAEAQSRGHSITAIARRTDSIAPTPNVKPTKGDLADGAGLSAILRGHDLVISATKFAHTNGHHLLGIVKAAGVSRWLVVGGAGSLNVAPGVELVDTPEFPAEYKNEALAGRDFLRMLRQEKEVNWTFLSPSALLVPGPRTGKFRIGGDELLVGANSESRISAADYAVAMIDEVENQKYPRSRFTVGY